MARWTGHDEIGNVLAAAEAWRQRCFLGDDSILTDEALWTQPNLDELYRVFTDNPIEGADQRFYEKLRQQLDRTPPEIKKLAAEALWLTLLFPHSGTIKPTTKRQHVEEAWATSGDSLVLTTPYLEDAYLLGVGHPGIGYLTGIPREFGFALDVVRRWKALAPNERTLEDTPEGAWRFGRWLDSIEGARTRPMRNAILYFLFPEFYERNLSPKHRQDIFNALRNTLPVQQQPEANEPSQIEVDQATYRIRRTLEQRLGSSDLDFYRPPLNLMWDSEPRERRRKQVVSALEGVISNYNLDLNQPGIKKNPLWNTRPTSQATGYWQDPNDATNKPLRWLLHLDLTSERLSAQVPVQHGARRIAFVNTSQGKSGSVLVRIVPAMKVAADRFEFFETWEWLLLLCFLPNLPVGSAAQLLENFDPVTGILTYMGQQQRYISAALIALNDAEATYTTEVSETVKTITYSEATAALAALLHVDVQPASEPATAAVDEIADA